jgi:hypothetical protein
MVTVTNRDFGSSGRLTLTALLPETRRVVKIGGPGHEFEDPYGQNQESRGYDPNDNRFAQYVGSYRVEIIPATPSRFDVFLNVLEANDADGGAASTPVLLTATGAVAVRVDEHITTFSRVEAPLDEAQITIDKAGRYKLLVCDLRPGEEYEVQSRGGLVRVTASEAGVAYPQVAVASQEEIVVRRSRGYAGKR